MPAVRGTGRKFGCRFDRNAGLIAAPDRWTVFGDGTNPKSSGWANGNSAAWRYLISSRDHNGESTRIS